MGYINGFTAIEVDETGDTYIARITGESRDELLYTIDSEAVSDVNVYCDGEVIEPEKDVGGGQTLLKYETNGGGWVGLTYVRENFAECRDGTWLYDDFWHLQSNMLFMIALPEYAVIRSLNARGLAKNQYKLGTNLVMSQYPRGGELSIDLTYTRDREEFESIDLPAFEESTLPGAEKLSYEAYREGARETRQWMDTTLASLDWASRALTLETLLRVSGLL